MSISRAKRIKEEKKLRDRIKKKRQTYDFPHHDENDDSSGIRADVKRKLIQRATKLLGKKPIIKSSRKPGQRKLSEVFLEFLEPYKPADEYAPYSKERFKKLITLGIMAWNLALKTEKESKKGLDDLYRYLFESIGDDSTILKDIIASMILRKRAAFRDDRRYIVDYELADYHDEYDFHLNLIWQPPPEEMKEL